jgi:hypothetical protein
MHKYFAVDQVGKDTWFQPVEELIGRPEFVCDRSGRWHADSNENLHHRPKTNGIRAQVISASTPAKGKKAASVIPNFRDFQEKGFLFGQNLDDQPKASAGEQHECTGLDRQNYVNECFPMGGGNHLSISNPKTRPGTTSETAHQSITFQGGVHRTDHVLKRGQN